VQYIFLFLEVTLNIATFRIKHRIKLCLFLWAKISMV